MNHWENADKSKGEMNLQLFADEPSSPEESPDVKWTQLKDEGGAALLSSPGQDAEDDESEEADLDDPDGDEAPEPEPLYFPRLALTDQNIPHTTLGGMLINDEDGMMYTVNVERDGTVVQEEKQIENDNIADATITGAKLEEATITSRELDMDDIFGDSAMIRQLMAENMDAAALFDNEEFADRYDERYWTNFIGKEINEDDLNKVTIPGRYMTAAGENIQNKPKDAAAFMLLVLKTGEVTLQQEFRTENETYVRDGKEIAIAEDPQEPDDAARSGVYEWNAWLPVCHVDITGKTVDFNEFTYANGYTTGVWKSRYNGGTNQMTNIPYNLAFVMELTAPRQCTVDDYIMRMRIMYGFDKSVHERWCVNGVWSAWKEYSKNGVVASAAKLETARTIKLSGGATGTATAFDGTANIDIPVTGLDMSKANAGTLSTGLGGTGQTSLQATRNAMGLGNTTGALPIANGGTGQTTVAAARNAFGLGNTTGAVPIANGGTGQTTAAAARNALGLGNTTGALPPANGGTGLTSLQATRNAMGLGNTTGALPPANGGTGLTSLQATRNAMGLGNTTGALPLENGGTGGVNRAEAWNKIVAGSGTLNASLSIANGGNITLKRSDVNGEASWGTDSRILTDIGMRNTSTNARSVVRIPAPSSDSDIPNLQFVRYASTNGGGGGTFWNIYHSGMRSAIPIEKGGTGAATDLAAYKAIAKGSIFSRHIGISLPALNAGKVGHVTVSFGVTFASVPHVVIVPNASSNVSIKYNYGVTSITTTGFNLNVVNLSGDAQVAMTANFIILAVVNAT